MLKARSRTKFENPVITVDFANRLALQPQGTTITAYIVEAEVHGESQVPDNAPEDTLEDDSVLSTTILEQRVKDGVDDVIYVYRFKITYSNNAHDEADVQQQVVKYVS